MIYKQAIEYAIKSLKFDYAPNEVIKTLLELSDKVENIDYLEEQIVTLSRSLADCYIRDFDRFVEYRERYEKLDKYNSELCMELTITMNKLCLAEKEIDRLKGEKL